MDSRTTADASESKQRRFSPLAIVGMGCLFPKADSLEAYWANIKDGVDAITEVPGTHWRPEDYFSEDKTKPDFTYGRRGGFIEPYPFEPLKYGMPPNVLEATDTSQLLGMVAAEHALSDAGYGNGREFDRNKVSVILGVTGALELVIPLGARLGHPIWRKAMLEAGIPEADVNEAMARMGDGFVGWQENSFPGLLGNVVAGRISKYLDLGGTNCVVDAACASSLSALHLAALELEAGKSDMVVTGGVDTFNDIFMYMCFSKTPALSPTGNSRPYDKDGDGTILGEGIGMLVLKRLADAERDGDTIYAVLKGVGSSSDGKGDAIYAPNSDGQTKALRDAYAVSGIGPDTIELLEGHGTGTKVGDAVEARALRAVYGDGERPWCALGSVKSQIGHTKAAAGSAGLIKAALALHEKVLPPTIKVDGPLKEVAPGASPFYVNTIKRPWPTNPAHPRRAAVSSFGFGGSNFHCVLEEYAPKKSAADWDGRTQIVALSATTRDGLKERLSAASANETWKALRTFAKDSRASFNAADAHRLLVVLDGHDEAWRGVLEKAAALLERGGDAAYAEDSAGVYYGQGAHDGEVAAIFPGQGAQYVGMLRDVACQFPQAIDALDAGNRAFGVEAVGERLSERVYPFPAFGKDELKAQEESLRATNVAQPGIGAVSLGALRVLEAFGFKAASACGHSYGELTALCAAGRLSEDDFLTLSRIRGELMAQGGGDRGAMFAVKAPVDRVAALVADHNLDVVLANKNAPEQVVLSGATEAIEAAAKVMKENGLSGTRLPVGAAFHSPLVADASGPFGEALAKVTLNPGAMPVYANTTAQRYPEDANEAKALLANQLANPVEFVAQIEAMHRDDARTFVEIGPGGRLSGLVKAILKDKPHRVFALDASNGKRNGIADLGKLLAQLAASGIALDLTAWDASFVPEPIVEGKPKLTVPISGANYRPPRKERPKVEKKAPAPAPQRPAVAQSAPQSAPAPSQSPVQSPAPSIPSMHQGNYQTLLQQTQANLAALQAMSEQTARLHEQFLKGQQESARAIQQLVQHQQTLFNGGTVPTAAPQATQAAPVPPPAPTPQPAAAEVPAAAPTPVAAPQPAADSALRTHLLEVVSEKTGYPVEMLELSMSLDGDLGIDSIKRVEILSALQERVPGLPAIEGEELGRIQTLQDVLDRFPDSSTAPAPASAAPAPSGNADALSAALLEVVSEKTGYPMEMLELPMSLDGDLGIDSIKRVEILSALQERFPELPSVDAEELGTLHTLQDVLAKFAGAVSSPPTGAPTGAPASAPVAADGVSEALIAIVSEKTGYPPEMLELSMSLDGDLGIDSIKRVEILSALQERMPELPTLEAEDLGALQTLGDVVTRLGSVAPALVVTPAPAASNSDLSEVLIAIVAEKTGYPVEMLELSMSLDSDLGIDSIKRVEILSAMQERVPSLPAVEAEDLGRLQTLQDVIDHLNVAAPAQAPQPVASTESSPSVPLTTNKPLAVYDVVAAPVPSDRSRRSFAPDGRYWVTDDGSEFSRAVAERLRALELNVDVVSLDAAAPERLDGLVLIAPESGDGNGFAKGAFALTQRASAALHAASGFFTTVSRVDGAFGLNDGGGNAVSGALAGLAKTADREWPDVTCRALDMGNDFPNTGDAAAALVEELHFTAPVEVGLSHSARVSPATTRQAGASGEAAPIRNDDVILVTGGARGVTAAVAEAIARDAQCTLALVGRSPLPDVESAATAGLTTEADIKRALLQENGGSLAPKELESRFRALMAAREIQNALDRMKAAGATVAYYAADMRDADALRSVVSEIAQHYGPVTGVIHGAGVLADKRIEDKTAEQFASVWDTKVIGLENLLGALANTALRFLVTFSSSTARLGRVGQSDYAMANEALNKIAQREAAMRPSCRVLSVNWGPWDGGMVTPALKALFEKEGVGVIGLQAGADYLVNALANKGAVETVVLGAPLKELETPHAPEDQAAPAAPELRRVLAVEASMERIPVLASHIIDGRAVVPMALYVEWCAHAALHANPGLRFCGMRDLRVTKGIIIDNGDALTVDVLVGKAAKTETGYRCDVELRSEGSNGLSILHARGQVDLSTRLPEGTPAISGVSLKPYGKNDALYANGELFHGEALQSITRVEGVSAKGITVFADTAPRPEAWLTKPQRRAWLADPLAIDSAFQALILWSFENHGAGSLPVYFETYTQFEPTFPAEQVEIVARIDDANAHHAVATIEFLNPRSGALVARMEGFECVIDATLNQAFQRNHFASHGQGE